MQYYHQNASVVYTDSEGRQIDTFVIFDTDRKSGLTHINHENLSVPADKLRMHPKTACQYHLPIEDAFSFEMLKKLRNKYQALDNRPRAKDITPEVPKLTVLAKAS